MFPNYMKGTLGATVLALFLTSNAKADLITMNGVFGPDSSYPGSILPGTDYSIAGVVDFTNDHYGTDGIGVYWLQTVTVTGAFGSIEFEDPNGRGLVFEIAEPSKSQSIGGAPNAYTIVFGRRQPGTVGLPGLNVIDSYQTATPTIDADAPVSPATFSDNVKHGSDLLALQKVGSSEILNWGVQLCRWCIGCLVFCYSGSRTKCWVPVVHFVSWAVFPSPSIHGIQFQMPNIARSRRAGRMRCTLSLRAAIFLGFVVSLVE
ncbi:MAG: hypothetical protein R3C56_01070 [Pirellulaceae bacterium]